MALQLEVSRSDGVIVVSCSGRIVFGEETTELAKTVRNLLMESSQIVLDLGAIRELDSGGLGTLLGLVSSARRSGGDIKLCNLSSKAREVLHITRLLTVVEAYSKEEEAVAAFFPRRATA